MKSQLIILAAVVLAIIVGLSMFFEGSPDGSSPGAATAPAPPEPVRIGVIPERDIFVMRRRQEILADYIAKQLGRPVQLVTGNSYATVLRDFEEKKIDSALLGSLVAVLCVDRLDAKVMLKTELRDGRSTYHGVICVPEDSPITSVKQLAGQSVAMVRTTTGGNLFPFVEMMRAGIMQGQDPPRIVWAGTHDDALDVMSRGLTSAAAAKNLRVEAWQRANPDKPIRILARSGEVPENSLVVRSDVADTIGAELARVMLEMDKSADGRTALAEYGATRFLPCGIEDYHVIYELLEELGDGWSQLGVEGPAPRLRRDVR